MWLRLNDFLNLHDRYLEAVGRSVLLAQSFEQNCKFVLLVWDLGSAYEKGEVDHNGLRDYSAVLTKRFLGTIVSRFGSEYGIKPGQFQILKNALDARNFIAHESATPCLYTSRSDETIIEGLPLFRAHVEALAVGDNLVAGWSYMIQEKDFPPSGITQRYPNEMLWWVFEPLAEYGYDGEQLVGPARGERVLQLD